MSPQSQRLHTVPDHLHTEQDNLLRLALDRWWEAGVSDLWAAAPLVLRAWWWAAPLEGINLLEALMEWEVGQRALQVGLEQWVGEVGLLGMPVQRRLECLMER